MSTRSDRARRRATRLRNQRIAFAAIVLIALAALGYFAWSAFSPNSTAPVATTPPPAAATVSGNQQGTPSMNTTASGLQIQDLIIGDGAEAQSGQAVTVHYTGWLMDGTKFDSSVDSGQPFTFNLGAGAVIAGWDEGIAGMKVGGKRVLIIPPDLGYGASGYPPVIPQNATLRFEVELLNVQ